MDNKSVEDSPTFLLALVTQNRQMCYMMLPPCYLDNTEDELFLLDNKDI